MRAFSPDSPPYDPRTRIVRLTKLVDFITGDEIYDTRNGPIGSGGGVTLAQVNAAIKTALEAFRRQELITVATNGQTVFTLSQAPTQPAEVMMTFRRVPRRLGVDFTIAGTTLTFTMPDIDTYAGDQLQVWYE